MCLGPRAREGLDRSHVREQAPPSPPGTGGRARPELGRWKASAKKTVDFSHAKATLPSFLWGG